MSQLPYRAEYAKSGRAGCKLCKSPIAKDELRLAVMVQSPFFDGMQPNWHHYTCFFSRARVKSTTDIAHFESLKWDDQERIRKKIESGGSVAVEATTAKKGKKRTNGTAAPEIPDINDYIVEYAKSGRAKCKVCEELIPKDEVRISKKDYESEVALQYGPHERWHHVDCFLKARDELGFTGGASILPGFMTLSPEDQKDLKSKIKPTASSSFKSDEVDGASPAKKPKEINDSTKDVMKKQNEKMFFFRDNLKSLHKSELISLLEYNNQWIAKGEANLLDRLSDVMTFGALVKCDKCKGGQFVFRSGCGYQCIGNMSEWSKCENIVDKPKRVPFKVPKDFKEQYPFMAKVDKKVSDRIFTKATSTVTTATATSSNSCTAKPMPLLSSLKFMLHKTENKSADEIKKQVEKLGGQIVKKFDDDVVAVISSEEEIKKAKLLKAVKSAKEADIHVISDDFFDEIKPGASRADLAKLLDEKKISDWGSNAFQKIPTFDTVDSVSKSVYPTKSVYPQKSMFKSDKSIQKVTLKGGLVVDPESKLEKIAHVYRKGSDIYSVILSVTDVQQNKNSYYKLQILEGDKKNKYWLFRAWGRIGTTIGGNKTEEYATLSDAKAVFCQNFEEKTGNMWEMRNNFEKIPGKYMMLDTNLANEEKIPKAITAADSSSSKLAKPVQDLITLIFDIEQMKKTMLEFEIDLNKMPLGKLSQKQLQKAFGVLNELQNLITGHSERNLILDKTNQFYTLVPHDFGIQAPRLLDDDQIIKDKITMLNDLMEIEIAYKMLQECDENDNPIDAHYEKLKADISVLDPNSDEFKYIELYVKNTHAKTHQNYSLEIQHVFKVERSGEASRYKKFSKLPNKKLLWHGSRLTNFAGILSQGLRIAPPEAPMTGYMFGKGVYFADMVSKSANYCATSRANNTGLMLLCEVALGNMQEYTKAHYVEKLPAGKHSVKGVGTTQPDPSEIVKLGNDVEVPLGKGVESKVKNTSLLYNEYIVYDVAQVKIQYLLRLKFNHKF